MNHQFAATPIAAEATTICATVSIGVAEHLLTEDIQATIDRADAALYRAKSEGRNRVEPAPTPPASSP